MIVAHRESTIAACDRVLVLDGGRCTEVAPSEVVGRTSDWLDAGRGG